MELDHEALRKALESLPPESLARVKAIADEMRAIAQGPNPQDQMPRFAELTNELKSLLSAQ